MTINPTAVARPAGRARPAVGTAAKQIQLQRRRYAGAVLSALAVARTYRGRPTTQVQQVLNTSLKPLGVRLTAAALHELAVNITAGRPVQLP